MKARSRLRVLLLPGIFALAGFIILIGLGVWQYERLQEKILLRARIEARVHMPAKTVPAEADWPKITADLDEYRRVQASGRFRHDREALVYTILSGPKGRFSGPGYWVFTPLELDSGATVMVNRGFVPDERKAPDSRGEGALTGPVTVNGLLRMPEAASVFTPQHDPTQKVWYRRDPAEIARAYGLTRVAPFLIDADATPNPGGLPQGGETRLNFPNNHLQYAITWFGLAAALAGVFMAFAWQKLKEGGR